MCTYTSVPFYTGGPHIYSAEVSSGYASTTYGATTDTQATSNLVTLTRLAWTVSLSTDATTFAAGQSVAFTATANQIPGTSPYFIRIFDQTTGSEIRYCTSTAVCTVSLVPFYTGGPHTYRAEISSGYAVTTYGATTDIQTTSNQVILARQSWSITLTASSVTGTGTNPSTVTTFSAVANQNAANTNYNYAIKVVDYTSGTVIASCSGSTCHPSVSLPASSPPHSYVAYVAAGSTIPLSDIQATSGGYSADNGSGAVLVGEATGGKNASEKACQCSHADPVNTATGEFFLSASDIGIVGVGPGLSIGRAYSTTNVATDSPFGYGWSANFSSNLAVVTAGTTADPLPRQVQVTQENGATALFTESATGLYSAPLRVLATLTHDATSGRWTFIRQSRQVMVFDSSGALLSVADLHGNAITVGRDGSGHVTSLTAAGGRSLTLTWTGSHVTGVADSAGRTVSYGYDTSGNLTSVTSVDGTAMSYGYATGHYMTTVTKPGGGVTTNTFDTSHRVTKQVDQLGRATTFSYGTTSTTTTAPDGSVTVEGYNNGQLISQTRASGTSLAETTNYGYDTANNVTTVTDPLGKATSYTYDANGDKLTKTDPLSRTTTWAYDGLGDVTSVTDPLGRVTTSTYNASGDLLTLTSPTSRVQSWTYNSDGTVASWIDGLGKITHYSYNSAGDQSSSTDADGRIRSIGYDAAGIVTSTTDPAGKVTTVTSDAAARVLTVTDPNGHTTTYGYDVDGNRTTVQDALGHTTTSAYDVAGQLTSSTDANGKITHYTYTAAGYPASKTDPNSHTTTYGYNALGLLSSVTDPASHMTQLGYDGAGRRVSVTLPSGSHSTVTYDVAGQVTASTDANAKTTTYGYDLDGEQTAVTDPLGRVTHTSYTGDGQVHTVTYPDTSVETYSYDALGQTTDFQNADGAHTTYSYDDAGLLTSKTEPGSITTTFSYNPAGLPSVTTKPDGSTVATSYDDAGQLTSIHYGAAGSTDTSYSYNATGQRVSMTDVTGTSSYGYDNTGKLTSQTNGAGQSIGYGYDNAGQLTSLTYPGSHTVSYGYNSAGRMTSLTDWSGNETDFTWTQDGQLASQADPNGVTQSRTYDAAGHTTGITTATTSATLAVFGYGYDAAGQLTSDSITDPSSSTASTHNYGYDPIGQLTTVNDGTITSSYAATSAGALTATTPGNTLAYNSAQQLVSLTPSSGPAVSYGYDANGARTRSTVAGTESTTPSTTGYSYSPSGSLASVALPATVTDPASTISYTSDGDGLRQSRTADGTTKGFLWATGGSLPLLLDDGTHSYLYGPSSAPIAQITDSTGTIRYLHSDLIGSTRVITSSTSAVVGSTRYDEYGNPVSNGTTTSDIGYSGNWTDPDTGLVYLRARDYDPHTAQFIAVDPAVDTTRQPYAYVANDPLLLTDPTGLDFWSDFGSNAAAFGAGVLDGATFGLSSVILGAVVPGYNCLIKDNAFFTAGSITGTIVSSIAITALTAGAGAGLAVAGIAGRLAIKEAVSVAVSAARRLVTTGIEKVATKFGEQAVASSSRRTAEETGASLFRGVSSDHPGFPEALKGNAYPRNPESTVSAAEHNAGNTDSPFTSWTRDPEVATNRAGSNGVVLQIKTGSRPGPNSSFEWSPDEYFEQEVLVRGPVEGAKVIRP